MSNSKNTKGSRIISFFVKLIAAAAFITLLVTMLPAAMPETDTKDGEECVTTRPELSIPFDEEMPDMDAVARPDLFPHLVIIYPEADSWGAEEAAHIKARLESRFHAHFVILSDKEYLALDEAKLMLYNAEPSLTINLGVNSLIEGSYLEIRARLGADGIEVKRTDNRIDFTSISYLRIHNAVDSLIDSLSFDGEYKYSEEIFICDERPSEETDFKPDFITDSKLDILTFSYVDSDPHTLRAIEGIVGHVSPDLVVFNGSVDGGSATRHELALLWQSISDILAKTNTPWCFTPGTPGGKLPRVTVCEVISSFPGCIRPMQGYEAAAFSLTVANSDGIVTASIYIADTFDDCSVLCDVIEAENKLYARASSYKRSVSAILPALPQQLYDAADGLDEEYVEDKLYDLFDTLGSSGADSFVCASDSVNTSIIDCIEGSIALCGSIGFKAHGLGGRFDYNNSLRGGVLMTVTARRANYSESELSYIYAADLGLNER